MHGKEAEPSAGILDSQSVKTTQWIKDNHRIEINYSDKTHDAFQNKIGMILVVSVTAASVQERKQAKRMFKSIKDYMPRVKLIWADDGYTNL